MITGQTVKNTYQGDGSNRVWNISFEFTDSSQIKFKVNGEEVTTNFALNTVAKTLTYPTVASGLAPLTSADEIEIYRDTEITQDIEFNNGGPLNAEMIEDGLDKLTMISQEIKKIAESNSKGTDGVYYPANDDELQKLFTSANFVTIDFSKFDFSSFNEDGYILNNKSFTFRNFSLGSWSGNFKWFKKPAFTLNNSQVIASPFAINASDIVVDDGTDNEPLIRVNNGHFQCQIGSITANNIETSDKIVLIELNNSSAHFTNYLISLNGIPQDDENPIENTGVAIEVSSSPRILTSECVIEIFGFYNIQYIKYTEDISTNIELMRTDLVGGNNNDINLILPNTSNLLMSYCVAGPITTIEPQFLSFVADTTYHKNDLIEANDKQYRVLEDFDSNDYINDIEQAINDGVLMEFYSVYVTGRWYSAYDPNERITDFDCMDSGYRANGLILNESNWNLPISDANLTATDAKNAIKELANRVKELEANN